MAFSTNAVPPSSPPKRRGVEHDLPPVGPPGPPPSPSNETDVEVAPVEVHRTLESLLTAVRACRACDAHLPLGPRPVVQAGATARILIVGQAPGAKVHASGVPWDDRSGDRLRDWMGIDSETFYDKALIAILPMGYCYPGRAASGDLPPRRPFRSDADHMQTTGFAANLGSLPGALITRDVDISSRHVRTGADAERGRGGPSPARDRVVSMNRTAGVVHGLASDIDRDARSRPAPSL